MQLFLLLVGLLILVLEFRLVFRPSLSRLASMTATLRQQFAELQETNQRLQTSEAQARTSAELHRNILATAMDGFWVVDLQGRILEVNAAYCRMSGYDETNLRVMNISNQTATLTPEEIAAIFQQVIAQGAARFETQLRRKDGSVYDVEVSAQFRPNDKTAVGFIRDITKQKKAAEVSARLTAIVESSDDCIIGKDLDGLVTSWNRGAKKIFDYSADEMIGASITRLIPPERQADEQEILDTIKRGQSVDHFETVRLRKDGERIDVSVTVSPILDTTGQIIGVSKVARDITRRKKTEQELKNSEERYRRVVENAPVIVYTFSPKRGGLYYSPQVQPILGYSVEYLNQHPFLWSESVHPDDRARIGASLRDFASGNSFGVEYRIADARGEWHWFYDRSIGRNASDGESVIEGLAIDITEMKQAEQEVRTAQEWHYSVLEMALDGFWLVDLQGRILEVNAAGCRMSGYSRSELLQLRISDLDVRMAQTEISRTINQIVTTGEARFESQQRRKDGQLFDVEVSAQYHPARAILVVFVRDITVRKQAEQKLQDSKRRLEETIEELQQAQHQILLQERLRGLGQMASGIAHDFNNALSPIIGFSELLLKHPEKLADHAQVIKWLTNIHTAASDAAGVVRRIREFSHQQQAAHDALTLIDPNQIVLQSIEMTEPSWKDQAQATGRTFHLSTDLEPLPFIVGEAFAIREMLTNLIFNALDAMPKGGTLMLSTVVDGEFVRLSVKDSGTGMTEDVRQHCLEPFFTTKGTEGTGLGLAMVHGIVKRHSGRVDIESTIGQGTTVIVRLPIPRETTELQVLTATPALSKLLRVLVVDDEPRLCELVKELLSFDGHTVETVENGEAALARLQTGSYDLVLTDKAMPQMSGEQLAVAIHQSAPSVPVILMTGFGDIMKSEGEMPPHIWAILSKPITETALREVLGKVFPPSSKEL